jgi:NAD(P)-dependent dehydrogenase (short-subunit alcohol dehydrogenase family)
MRVEGKAASIGGASGLGKADAAQLPEEGAQVVVNNASSILGG